MSGNLGAFSVLAISCKIDLIDKLKLGISASPSLRKSEFLDLLNAVFGMFIGLDPKKLSDELGFSYNMVTKWIARKTAPHPILWPRAISWVERSLDEKRNELEILLAA